MDIKDYYGILQVEASASALEIKQAYRRLAKKLHPDKNPGDAYAAAQFAEAKEAYEVLTNPGKKEYYLQQRWYNQSIGKRRKQEVITPVTILQQALELDRYVASLDVFRMDKAGLKDYIHYLLSDEVIQKLQQFDEPETNRQIINAILRAAKPIPHLYVSEIAGKLSRLSNNDEAGDRAIRTFVQKEASRYKREKYSLLVIIIITGLICLIIWLSGR